MYDRMIAIMLGQLEMDIDECIVAYKELVKTGSERMSRVVLHKPRIQLEQLEPGVQLDEQRLSAAIANLVRSKGYIHSDLFTKKKTSGCRVYFSPDAFIIDLGKLT